MFHPKEWLWRKLIAFLTRKPETAALSPHDIDCVRTSLQPADVILIEGRSRVGSIIKIITRSSWSHAAICIGSLNSIRDRELRAKVAEHWEGDADEALLIEAEIDRGTVVTPLSHYYDYHMRICKPIGLSKKDRASVVAYVIERIGQGYNVHQLLDLARFLLPWWTVIPRRWQSSLFEHNAGEPTRTVCSSLIADAFHSVEFPILPLIQEDAEGRYRLFRRNPKLFVPRDFDYSPFFDVVKCPLLVTHRGFTGKPRSGYYHDFEWAEDPHPERDAELHRLTSLKDVLHVGPSVKEGDHADSQEPSGDSEGDVEAPSQGRGGRRD